jgi:homopolymeric O-antigen transport system permease protein
MLAQILRVAKMIAVFVVRVLMMFYPPRVLSAMADALRILYENRRLTLSLAKRELTTRYAGQFLGSFWIIAHPVFQMLIFLLLFAIVFKVRIDPSLELPRNYTIYIFSGLVPWLSIVPVLSTAPVSILSNSAFVKQFDFSVELLQVKEVLIPMMFWFVGIGITILFTLVAYRTVPWTYIFLPYLLVVQFLTVLGFAWALSAICVFARDLKDALIVYITLGVYILPIVYLPQWVPTFFKPLIYINPFSSLIWMYQDVLYYGRFEHPKSWVVGSFIAVIAFSSGHRIFQRLRPAFGNAL